MSAGDNYLAVQVYGTNRVYLESEIIVPVILGEIIGKQFGKIDLLDHIKKIIPNTVFET